MIPFPCLKPYFLAPFVSTSPLIHSVTLTISNSCHKVASPHSNVVLHFLGLLLRCHFSRLLGPLRSTTCVWQTEVHPFLSFSCSGPCYPGS